MPDLIPVRCLKLPTALFALLFVAVPGLALASDGAAGASQEHDEAMTEDHAEGHEYWNSLHLFLGETWERVDGADMTERGFTFGLEYFREVAPGWAVGGVVERAGGNIRGTLLLAQVEFRIVGGLWAVTGPGVEFRDAHEEGPQHHGGEASIVRAAHDVEQIMRERDTTVFVYRIGLAYVFEVGNLGIGPAVDLDFVGRDEALVLGVITAYHF